MTEYVWRPPAINGGWENILRRELFHVWDVEPFGPMGLRAKVSMLGQQGSVIVTQAEHDGQEWLHASLAFAERDPTYLELAYLHRAVFGRRRFSVQVFAPEDQHVNLHSHALHLWGRVDGTPFFPEFGAGGSI